MPLDPDLVPLEQQLRSLPSMSLGTPAAARERFRRMCVAAQRLVPTIEVGAVEDVEVSGAAGPLRGRIYRPPGGGPTPTLLFIHGGGFVIGGIDSYDRQCRVLCLEAGATVLAIEYRLAPDDPFPAAVDDSIAACRWTLDSVDRLGGDPDRVAIGGDSAGGNLAAVTAQAMQDESRSPGLAAQLLLYPVTDFSSQRPSHAENGEDAFLSRDDMDWFERCYLGDGDPSSDPRVSPLLAKDLSGLPPAVVVTAELDPLRDDGEAYAEALAAAGVPVVRRRYDALVHGFFGMGQFSNTAESAIGQVCEDLREMLA